MSSNIISKYDNAESKLRLAVICGVDPAAGTAAEISQHLLIKRSRVNSKVTVDGSKLNHTKHSSFEDGCPNMDLTCPSKAKLKGLGLLCGRSRVQSKVVLVIGLWGFPKAEEVLPDCLFLGKMFGRMLRASFLLELLY